MTVHLRDNCIVGIPRHPVSCSAATTDLSELTGSLVALALGDLGEGFGLAQIGRAQPASMSVISGTDPRHGNTPFVNQLILAVTGGAGAPQADGWLTILGIGAAGFLYRDSVEIDEMKYPIVVHEQRIVPDRKAPDATEARRAHESCSAPLPDARSTSSISATARTTLPWVCVAVYPDETASQRKIDRDGAITDELGSYAHVTLQPGETIVGHTCGGGGYGPPHERDVRRVEHDVREGWISPARAFEVYGVKVDQHGQSDDQATAARRSQLRAASPAPSSDAAAQTDRR